ANSRKAREGCIGSLRQQPAHAVDEINAGGRAKIPPSRAEPDREKGAITNGTNHPAGGRGLEPAGQVRTDNASLRQHWASLGLRPAAKSLRATTGSHRRNR